MSLPVLARSNLMLLALLGLLAPVAARGQTDGPESTALSEAERLYDEGVAAVQEGDYRGALGAFRASYDLDPAADVLYNVGVCLQAVGDPVGAANTFRQYLDDFGGGASPDELDEIGGYLSELEVRVARLAVRCTELGASVAIDGLALGTTPIGEWVALEPGRHAVVVTKEGFEPMSDVVTIAAGELAVVSADLSPLPGFQSSSTLAQSHVGPESPSAGEVGSADLGPWFWSCVGLAGAATVTLAITGGLTLSYKDDYVAGGATDQGLYDTTFALRTTTDVFLGVAIAAAAAATLIGILGVGAESGEEQNGPETAVLATPSGLLVRW